MTANTQETGSLQALFKRRYVDGVANQLPSFAKLQGSIAFDAGNKTGDRYERAVMLRYPNGATYAGGSNLRTVYSYNNPVAGATQPAYVKPTEYTLREQIAYGLVSAAATSEQAFASAMDVIVMAMTEASAFHLETCLLYGGDSLGTSSAVGGSGTTGTFTVSKATWSAALWSAAEGMEVDTYDPTLTTQRNTNGAAQITGVDPATRILTIEYAAGADRTATLSGDVIVPRGAKGAWFDGINTLIANSAAGTTVLGISPTTYGSWKANTFAAGSAALTFTKIAQAASAVAARGGAGPLTVLVSPWSWVDVMNDQAALRQYIGQTGGEFENGADKLTYHGPNGGALNVEMHPLVKAGEAFIINYDDFKRVGDSEPTFNLPGRGSANNPMFLQELSGSSGFEIRRWWSQAVFCDRLVRTCKITGIVNNSL